MYMVVNSIKQALLFENRDDEFKRSE